MGFILEDSPAGVLIAVKVVPGASRTAIAGLLGSCLKIAVSKPPSGGEANRAVVELLAESLTVSRSAIVIVSGHTNPLKRIRIIGVSRGRVQALGN